MKFQLCSLIVVLLADVCTTKPTTKDLFARTRKRRADSGSDVAVFIRSEGCEDPGKTGCGKAFIQVDGIEHSLKTRGFNIVVVDGTTGDVLGAASFDTHGDTTADDSMKDYLNAINGDKIVLVGIGDEGSRYLGSEAIDALRRVGAVDPVDPGYRGSFALAGHAEAALSYRPTWITQQTASRGQGPSEISITIPLTTMLEDCEE